MLLVVMLHSQAVSKKEKCWSELAEVMQSIHRSERVLIGVDFSGHVRAGCRVDEELFGHVWYR